MNICKNNLCELLEASLEFVNGEDVDLSSCFYKAVEKNEQNYVAFNSELQTDRKSVV